MASLYERLGGEASLAVVIERMHSRVLVDDSTRAFFEGVDMTSLSRRHIAFLTVMLGGPGPVRRLSGLRIDAESTPPEHGLRAAHTKLVKDHGLGDEHFNAVVGHLLASLREVGIAEPLVLEVLDKLARLRNEVLNRTLTTLRRRVTPDPT